MLVFLMALFLVWSNIFLHSINDSIPDDVICNIAIYSDDMLFTLSVIMHLMSGNN